MFFFLLKLVFFLEISDILLMLNQQKLNPVAITVFRLTNQIQHECTENQSYADDATPLCSPITVELKVMLVMTSTN